MRGEGGGEVRHDNNRPNPPTIVCATCGNDEHVHERSYSRKPGREGSNQKVSGQIQVLQCRHFAERVRNGPNELVVA